MRHLLWILLLGACDQTPKPAPAPATTAPASAPDSAAPGSTAPTSAAPASKAVIPPGTPTPLGDGTDGQIENFELGKQALDKGDEATALKHFQRASDGPISGPSVSAALAAANLHELRDRPDQAKAIFVRMVALAPGVPELRFAAARFFAGQRDTERAIEGFRATIRHQPEFLPAYPMLAALWMQAGKQDDATQLLLTYESKLNAQLRRLRDVRSTVGDKVAVLDLLALIADDRASEGMIQALKDTAPEVRIAAAGALGSEGSPGALKALAEALVAEKDPIAKQVLIAATRRAKAALEAEPSAPATLPAPRSDGPR